MKKISIKSFALGCAITLLVTSSISVLAAETIKNATLYINATKLTIDGKASSADTLNYKDVLYVPVEKVTKEFGFTSNYDGKTKTVNIATKKAEAPKDTTDYSRTNPAPINTVQSITVKTASYDYTAAVRVIEIMRGEKAWKLIADANQFNSPAKDGYEYVLAKIAVSAVAVGNDKSLSVNEYDFKCFSTNNEQYNNQTMVVEPEPRFSSNLFTGGSTEGYVAFEVKKGDASPKMVYEMKYDGSGGIWFKLY